MSRSKVIIKFDISRLSERDIAPFYGYVSSACRMLGYKARNAEQSGSKTLTVLVDDNPTDSGNRALRFEFEEFNEEEGPDAKARFLSLDRV